MLRSIFVAYKTSHGSNMLHADSNMKVFDPFLTDICSFCYDFGDQLMDCSLPMKGLNRVLSNYESLSAIERSQVSDESYWIAKEFMSAGDALHCDADMVQGLQHAGMCAREVSLCSKSVEDLAPQPQTPVRRPKVLIR
ncbi:hypothetical protein BWQ96_00647 [Gracilariopsis chorda]|uniref:Uncharacterized protein n=1 Tax=Gracilariopsis chorda TaxID=448386 RepID=A0A2V3J6F7_9FLOR|nr:hypothetical protein BWQ96_00647 [Gracilariopsis chorda]|eukprot:PXF49577.1 hypothetical protein BWQ96_00647 [Gracilariopsis chorda]